MFEFSSSLFFWTLLNFLVLLIVVHKVALPAFLKMAQESEDKKAEALREIETANSEAKLLLATYKEKLANVEEEARQILSQAQKERDALRKAEMEKMLQEKHDLLQGIRNEVEVEKKKFISDVKSETVELILSTAKTLIGRELKSDDHQAIIEKNIQEFNALVKR
jgi:F-type H+-transporting ATPase subunit b